MHRHTEHNDPIDQAFDAMLSECLEMYSKKQASFAAVIAPYKSWALEESRNLHFSTDQESLSFDVTAIATYLPEIAHLAFGNYRIAPGTTYSIPATFASQRKKLMNYVRWDFRTSMAVGFSRSKIKRRGAFVSSMRANPAIKKDIHKLALGVSASCGSGDSSFLP